MLWYAARVGVEHKLLVLAACDCAETALQYWRKRKRQHGQQQRQQGQQQRQHGQQQGQQGQTNRLLSPVTSGFRRPTNMRMPSMLENSGRYQNRKTGRTLILSGPLHEKQPEYPGETLYEARDRQGALFFWLVLATVAVVVGVSLLVAGLP